MNFYYDKKKTNYLILEGFNEGFSCNCKLYFISGFRNKKINLVESGRREYYGISWWKDCETLVLSHSGLDNEHLHGLESYVNSEKGYLSFGKTQTAKFLSQPHQILCAPDDIVIATNTGRNCITLYNNQSGFRKDIRINEIYWDRLGLENACGEHFNSVFLKNDRLYVVAHRFKKISHILVFSYPNCVLLEKIETKFRSGLHNVWVDNNKSIFACHSESGSLIEVNSNETIWESSTFLRGLAACSDYIIVGDSDYTIRENRKYLPSQIWVIDRKTFNTLDYIPLGNYGGVHEVRLLDVPDEAHHNTPFSNLGILEAMINEQQNQEVARIQDKIHLSKSLSSYHIRNQYNFIFILNSWSIEDEWLTPKNGDFTLSLAKKIPSECFTASLDFALPESTNLSEQHLSFVFGYHGPDDANMWAILIFYAASTNSAHVALWAHKGDGWKMEELLFKTVPITGKLTIKRLNDQLTIQYNQLQPIIRNFNPGELDGAVGIRALGAKFKNFTLSESSQKQVAEPTTA